MGCGEIHFNYVVFDFEISLLFATFYMVQIWSLALGTLLRSIVFPVAVNAVVLDPGEYALYAGGIDGRIFITALNFGVPTASGILADGLLGTDAALMGHT